MIDLENKTKISRPSWDEYFLKIAETISTRSCDGQTKHGCVIVDSNHHIVGTGYNSFCRKFPDDKLPNLRPDKYKLIQHAEKNGLLNCLISPWTFNEPLTLYCTGRPCLDCLQMIINSNIGRIVVKAGYNWSLGEDEEELFFFLLKNSKIMYEEIDLKNS